MKGKMETTSCGNVMLATISRTNSVMSFVFFLIFTAARSGDSLKTYKMPGETCGYVVENGDQYKVISHQLPMDGDPDKTSYQANVSCSITFRTDHGKRNFLRLSMFEVETSRLCAKDGLYLYDGGREISENLLSANNHALCGTTLSLPNYFTTAGHEVTIKFVTDGANNFYRGFTLLITPFSETDNCDGFTCLLTKRCITKDAACNNEYQCEDGSDEPGNCHLLGNKNIGTHLRCSMTHMAIILSSMVAVTLIFTDTRITL